MKKVKSIWITIGVLIIASIGGFTLIDKVYADDIEGVAIGGKCAVCGTWIPAGKQCACWQQKEPQSDSQGGSPQTPSGVSPEELARQREQQLHEEEEARKHDEERRIEFEQNKQKALKMLKSGVSQLGLKGVSEGGPALKTTISGLKEPLFSKGTQGSAPPYLGGLDSKRPVIVDPSKVQGQTSEALYKANRRTHVLLDALEANPGNWEGSIQYLRNRLAESPNDLAVRDALNLVRGYSRGYLGAKEVADNYYKYGVRKWLEGDFDLAARSFARAYRENPDDKLLFCSFAHSLGLRNNSNKRKGGDAYIYFDIPKKSIVYSLGITSKIEQNLKEARAAVSADPANLELRATLNYLEGIAGYHEYLDIVLDKKAPPLDRDGRRAIQVGLSKLGEKDYVKGWTRIAKVWGKDADEHMALFAINYAKGLAASERGETENVPISLSDQRTEEAYEKYLKDIQREIFRASILSEQNIDEIINDDHAEDATGTANALYEQLNDTENKNPFFGVLSEKEIKEIKEQHPAFF